MQKKLSADLTNKDGYPITLTVIYDSEYDDFEIVDIDVCGKSIYFALSLISVGKNDYVESLFELIDWRKEFRNSVII